MVITDEFYNLAIRQAKRFHNLDPVDREDLVQDTFERLINSGLEIDINKTPAGFIYHCLKITFKRRLQALKKHEPMDNSPLKKGKKPRNRTQWDGLNALLAVCEETIHLPSFSPERFREVLDELLLNPKDREFAKALFHFEVTREAAKYMGINSRTGSAHRLKRIKSALEIARKKAIIN